MTGIGIVVPQTLWLLRDLLKNYSPKKGLTQVELSLAHGHHSCITTLIFLGYLTPVSNEWSSSSGRFFFRMVDKRFHQLKGFVEKAGGQLTRQIGTL